MTLLQLLEKAHDLAAQGLAEQGWVDAKQDAAEVWAGLFMAGTPQERELLEEIRRMLEAELSEGIARASDEQQKEVRA